jgi:5-methylcytosine-specific restriction protein A
MARKEFSVATKRKIVERSKGVCERHLWKPGEVCTKPAKEFDHLQPDGLSGKPTLENGAHLCVPCHRAKTHEHDTPIMRRADAQKDAANGIKRKSRPISQAPKVKRESKPRLPPLPLYVSIPE